MSNLTRQEIGVLAQHAARTAGQLIRQIFLDTGSEASLGIEEKHGHTDIVTRADREAEAVIWKLLREGMPNSRILGEEGGWQGEGEVIWYVDPVDGTSNFASGLPLFCVSIAATKADGSPLAAAIYDPMADEMFACWGGALHLNGAPLQPVIRATTDRNAEVLSNLPREGKVLVEEEFAHLARLFQNFRAVRRIGSAALQLAYVAVGRAAVNYDRGCHPWDLAAGLQLIKATGGQIRAWDKESGAVMADPMRNMAQIDRIVTTTPGYELDGSAVLGDWA